MLKKNLTIKDFSHYIPQSEIDFVLGKRRAKKFWKYMRGQTVSIYGVFPDDLDRFLKGLPVID